MTTIGLRALNRATLARQLLLERTTGLDAAGAIEHLVGLQGQAPDAPYVTLWSRLRDFEPAPLASMLETREVVRAPLMRGTIHLVTARDAPGLRALAQPVLERAWASSPFARALQGVDVDAVVHAARALLDERPLTRAELGVRLAERWPEADRSAMAYAATFRLPLVQVPPRGVWGSRAQATWTTFAAWLGREPEPSPAVDDAVLRYLAAFGPASARDAGTWSGLPRMAEVLDRLRPRLVVLRDERGTELFDLPDAPRPDPDTPAPPRFLAEYDNVLLSHADRSRVIDDGRPIPLAPGNGAAMGTVLVDGRFAATWRVHRDGDAARLAVATFGRLPRADAAAVAGEGARLLAFVAPGARHDVDVAPEG